ncbi:MAG: hypothetical protein AVO34_12585 [Firmicutes bacterium ML8_F2]|jgi:hypothetical protein|nr:MAG: hypothetical protein AVO34_12585 [Firmicutes bacterium ML8_F2]
MSHKKYQVENFELQYSSDWIHKLESLDHWKYYWHQAYLVQKNIDKNFRIIEIGIGSSFLANYLKSRNWEVITIDIDPEKKPDIVGDISSTDLSDLDIQCVIAFEVFEHLPFPLFVRTINNISTIKPRFIIFSLPLAKRNLLKISVKLPKIRNLNLSFSINKKAVTTPNHFWELKRRAKQNETVLSKGEKGFVSKQVMKEVFINNGFQVNDGPIVNRIQFFIAKNKYYA